VRIKEEERFSSIHTSHNVKGNSIQSLCFFVLTFEETRAERPHLLAEFSPVLGFPCYILCLSMMVYVNICLCSLFFVFNLFHIF
jgi:hypothetical protein